MLKNYAKLSMESTDELMVKIVSLVAQVNWQQEEIEKLREGIKELEQEINDGR